MHKTITAEITKNKNIILNAYATFNKEKADVIIALANEIAEDLGAPSANNILIDIANKVKHGSYQANVWDAHKDQSKTCCKCGIKKSLFNYNNNCHYLDYKNKTCNNCLALDVKKRGDFQYQKLSEEIVTITGAILNQTQIDDELVTLSQTALSDIQGYPHTHHSPYKLQSLKNQLIAKCQKIGFDYKKYSKNTSA